MIFYGRRSSMLSYLLLRLWFCLTSAASWSNLFLIELFSCPPYNTIIRCELTRSCIDNLWIGDGSAETSALPGEGLPGVRRDVFSKKSGHPGILPFTFGFRNWLTYFVVYKDYGWIWLPTLFEICLSVEAIIALAEIFVTSVLEPFFYADFLLISSIFSFGILLPSYL